MHIQVLHLYLSAITLKFFLGQQQHSTVTVHQGPKEDLGRDFSPCAVLPGPPFSHTELPSWQHTEILSACPLSCTPPQKSQCPGSHGTWSSEPPLGTRNPLASASAGANREQDEAGKETLKCGAVWREINILRSSTRTDTTPPL